MDAVSDGLALLRLTWFISTRGVSLAEFPPVPLTLEGSAALHQFFRFDWKAWRSCAGGERSKIVAEFTATLRGLERSGDGKVQTGLFSELGHKGDLILVHFRDSFE